ncbi:MAG: DUF2125 domain-containing protein, partial [Pseudomonadota bacterium]
MASFFRSRWGLYAPVLIAGLLVAAYVLAWRHTADRILDDVEAWAQAQEAAGRQASYAGLRARGFPRDLRVEVEAPVLGAPEDARAWTWSADRLELHATPFNPNHLVALVDGAQRFSYLDDPGPQARPPKRIAWSIDAASARASLVRGAETGDRLRLNLIEGEIKRVDEGLLRGGLAFDDLTLHVETEIDAGIDEQAVLTGLDGKGLVFKAGAGPLGETDFSLTHVSAAAFVTPAASVDLTRLGRDAFAEWAERGGEIEIAHFQA